MADTGVKSRGSRREHHLPSAFHTLRVRHPIAMESEFAGSELEGREGAAKRPRVESSSSDWRDGSEESRSGGGRDRPGRCSQRAAGPSIPPRRPIPASVSPRRSPRLTKSAVQGLRSLPLTTKGGRRTAHSRSVSEDERGQGPSRSSLSSSDHGRSSQGRRSRSRPRHPS